MSLAIDLEFLKSVEGYTTEGVVPSEGSGPTVGLGIDMGQQNEKSLRDAGLSPDEIRVFKPYLGKKGKAAESLLKRQPLNITEQLAEKVSMGVINDNLEKLQKKYNKGATVKFDELSPQQQTVLFSVTHQYGINGAPKTLAAAKVGDWASVSRELDDPKDKYKNRRRAELAYLNTQQIKAGNQKVRRNTNEPIY